MRSRVVGFVAVSALALVGCSGSGAGHAVSSTVATTAVHAVPVPAYSKPGPDVVSISTLLAVTGEVVVLYPGRRGSENGKPHATYDIRDAGHDPNATPLPTDPSQLVSIPAFANLPAAPGRFPVVLFSDAYGATPMQSITLETDLAAWGFVVIAPDFQKRDTLAVTQGTASVNDARDAVDLEMAFNAIRDVPRLGRSLDLAHVGVVGYAQGGATALTALAFPFVDAAVVWASVAPTRPVAAKPVMLIGAQHDLEFGPATQRLIEAKLSGPRRLVLLGGGVGHASFTDACEVLRTSGVLNAGGDVASDDPALDLTQNGCYPDEVDPVLVWPVVTHFTVAELRSVFGLDRAPIGLGDSIAHAFPRVPLTYEHRP